MMTLKEVIHAARHHQPLKERLDPARQLVFELAQGPGNAPMAWGMVAAAIAALFFISIVRLSVPSQVQLISDPAGAEVFVDGLSVGTTPLTLKDLRGRHNIEIRQENFQVKTLAVDISAFSPSKYTASLTPVPPKPKYVAPEEKQQSLAAVFMTKAPEKAEKKPAAAKRAKGSKKALVAWK